MEVGDPCASRPCLNNGLCEVTGADAYRCQCQAGFTGDLCQDDITSCGEGVCWNDGTCFEDFIGWLVEKCQRAEDK